MVKVRQEFCDNSDDFSCELLQHHPVPCSVPALTRYPVTTVNTIIWGSIEPCMSVIAACLPVLGPIIFKKRRQAAEVKIEKFRGLSLYFRTVGTKGSKVQSSTTTHAPSALSTNSILRATALMASIADRKSESEVSKAGGIHGHADYSAREVHGAV
jgi:hypothetical protein